jgi:hypothetical protein
MYSLDAFMAWLSKGVENPNSIAFLVSSEKIWRLLRLIIALFMHGFMTCKLQVAVGWCSGVVGGWRLENYL